MEKAFLTEDELSWKINNQNNSNNIDVENEISKANADSSYVAYGAMAGAAASMAF